jgi:hypothetical protein
LSIAARWGIRVQQAGTAVMFHFTRPSSHPMARLQVLQRI